MDSSKKMEENGEKVIGAFDEEDQSVVTAKSDGENVDSKLDSCGCVEPLPSTETENPAGQVQKSASEKSENIAVTERGGPLQVVIQPHSQLPKPEAPPGLLSSSAEKLGGDVVCTDRRQPEKTAVSENFAVDVPAIGKFIRERSNKFSAAFVRRLSSLKESRDEDRKSEQRSELSEFSLSGLRVTVMLKSKEEVEEEQKAEKEAATKGRISFFSRSNCRDCSAVRRFFKEKGLRFVEINVDVYPQRQRELVERTGSSAVPQIFFNEKLFGGLVALNSLRNSGEFDHRLKEMVGPKCPDDAPAPPVYGFDDEEVEEPTDEMISIVRVLRQRLPYQDRLMKMKMKIVKNCFAGGEMVDAIALHLNCDRRKVRTLKVSFT